MAQRLKTTQNELSAHAVSAGTKHTAAATEATMRRARPLDKGKKRLAAQPTAVKFPAPDGRGGGKPPRELRHPKRSFEDECRNNGGS